MSDTLTIIHVAVGILAAVLLITTARITPLVALMIGAIYIGLATGLGFEDTTQTIATGFGELMAEIGLLIAFGVLLGSFLSATGTLQRVMQKLVDTFGTRTIPYVFSLSTSTLFPAIYSDVLLVLTAPLSRSLAPRLGRNGIAVLGGALTAGIEVGLVFTIPGTATLAVAGLLGVPIGTMLVYGLIVAIPTATLTTFVFNRLIAAGLWDPPSDELAFQEDGEENPEQQNSEEDKDVVGSRSGLRRKLPLGLMLLPVVAPLLLIAFATISGTSGLESGLIAFLGDPIIALFTGLVIAYALVNFVLTREEIGSAIGAAFSGSGQILILTGVSGSLAAIIGATGLDEILGGYFSAGALSPLLLVWLVAAVLHIALGSISVAAITAAGILAPIAGTLDLPIVLIALAAGSGALFVPHVSSNFFWMFQGLLRLSTRGTFKAHSVSMTLASIISLIIILIMSAVL